MGTHYHILILGGGTAGLTVASQLADRIGGHHIGIVEPSLKHYFSMYALKAYLLPLLYWHGMLRGRA